MEETLIWIDGRVMPLSEARVGVEDRGFQFADGVYEVIRIYNGRPFTLDEHLERLERSADGIEMRLPVSSQQLAAEIVSLVSRSEISEGMIYLQLTRGVARRNHVWDVATVPTLLFYVRPLPPVMPPGEAAGVRLLAVADERWRRCWIKSIALLPNVLAKNAAVRSGADEAVFVEDDRVSECSTSNLFAVIGRTLVTAPVGKNVLPGITRQVILQLAEQLHISVEQRHPTLAEIARADELFISSTTREISWVSHWDQRLIAEACGPMTRRLHEAYQQLVGQTTEDALFASSVTKA